MFSCSAEYYTDIEPITRIIFFAWTKRGAVRKAYKNVAYVNKLNCGTVRWVTVWFRGKEVY